MLIEYLPALIQFIIAVGFAATIVILSYFFGPKKPSPDKIDTYECGVRPIGDAWGRFHIRYYLIAILFVVFDIEAVFLYPWAVIFKKLGFFGFIEMLIFLAVLFIGLIYAWKKGALEWD